MKYTFLLFFFIPFLKLFAFQDTLKTYRLGEIISTSTADISPSSVANHEVSHFAIDKISATNMSEVETLIPSASIVTNSRGESLLYLRGASDRQLGLFLNGAPLNIGWDNRMDLSLIPTSIVGSMNISGAGGSILYGPNAMGGVLNILTRERKEDGFGGIVKIDGKEANSYSVDASLGGKDGSFSWLANAQKQNSDGFLISKNHEGLVNQREDLKMANNTDRNFYSYFANAEYKFAENKEDEDCKKSNAIGLSLLGFGGEKGVSSQPRGEKTRFWRYDGIQRNMAILNGSFIFCGNTIRISSWLDSYGQTINKFASSDYSEIKKKAEEDDLSYGAHIIYNLELGEGEIIDISLLAQDIQHTNISDNQDYGQYLFSFGAEYNLSFKKFTLSAGAAFDMTEYYETGEHTGQEGKQMDDYSLSFGGVYKLGNNNNLYANYSRKTRFPTMREQFDEALGKFFVNPNLLPEKANSFEIGSDFNFNKLSLKSAVFFSQYSDLIEKKDTVIVSDNNNAEPLETRVNLSSGRAGGIEISALWQAHRRLNLSLMTTYMFAEGRQGEKTVKLNYKPQIKLFSYAVLKLPYQSEVRSEIDYEGTQWYDAQELPPSLVLNLRLGHKIIFESTVLDLYLRLNNLLDEARYSKIGIPESGRTIMAGTSFIF